MTGVAGLSEAVLQGLSVHWLRAEQSAIGTVMRTIAVSPLLVESSAPSRRHNAPRYAAGHTSAFASELLYEFLPAPSRLINLPVTFTGYVMPRLVARLEELVQRENESCDIA